MEHAQARAELLRHAGLCDDYYEHGFLGCLRPFTGMREANFHAVIEAILSVGSLLCSSESVDRMTVLALFELLTRARQYAIDDDGMLVRNRLITEAERSLLKRQIGIIERQYFTLLSGHQPHEALHCYCEYVAEHGWGENFGYFLPTLARAIESEEFGDRLQGYCDAIVRLGSNAHALEEPLRQARTRHWAWFEPLDRCHQETIGYIDSALCAIGAK